MDRRKESRLYAEVPAMCATADGTSRSVFISEISSNGCRLSDDSHELAPGDSIQLSLGPVDTAATVRWRTGALVGVEFAAPLHAAIVSYFTAYCRSAA